MNDFIMGIWSELYTGFVGAFIIWCFSAIWKYYQNKKIEKKYNLSGNYLSVFEDIVDNQKVQQVAPAIFKQRGYNIKGYTILEKRKWILEGQISENGYIYGIYFSENKLDGGLGNFFLEFTSNDNLDGIWSGYDSTNHMVVSGRYNFVRANNYEIMKLKSEDIYQGTELIESQLGKDYISLVEIKRMIEDENYICYTVKEDNKIIGIGIGLILDTENALSYMKVTDYKIPKYVRASNKIGILKTIAIAQKSQKRGIGTKLVERMMQDFQEYKVNVISCVAWKHGVQENIGGIMKYFEFNSSIEIKDYWKKESEEENFTCPICGTPPCLCQAKIYFKGV